MKIDHIRSILAYNEKNYEEINSKVKNFHSLSETARDDNLLNFYQIGRSLLEKRDHLLIEIPLGDKEFGAMCYKGDGFGCVIINSSQIKVNMNFMLARQIYRVLYEKKKTVRIDFSLNSCFEHEEEYAANLFAGILLLEENSFRRMYRKFERESNEIRTDILIRLMAYYQVPYAAVLIRCLELDLMPSTVIFEDIFNIENSAIQQRLSDMWLDEELMEPTKKDDYLRLRNIVEQTGMEYMGYGFLDERIYKKALLNMDENYEKVKGE